MYPLQRRQGFKRNARLWRQCRAVYATELRENSKIAGNKTKQRFMIFCVWERIVGSGHGQRLTNALFKIVTRLYKTQKLL